MKIGILLPGFSSSERDPAIPAQHDLLRLLGEREQVRVLALRYPHHRRPYTVFATSVTPFGAGQTRGIGRLALWLRALQTLERLHCERPFDVLHAMWADETGLIAAWAGRRLKVPVVVSLLGGELARLDDIGYGLQRGRFSRWVVGQALAGATRIVAAGPYAARALAGAGYHVPDDSLVIAPLGVDAALFQPADKPPDPRRLLYVGSLIPVKDPTTLLHMLTRLPESITLDIAGDGPEWTRLETLARRLNLHRRARFLGHVERRQMPALYQQAALHVMASRSEALPIAALEAAATGVHTVATAVGALPDYPAIATTVPVGDADVLAATVAALLDRPARRIALGKAAREAVEHQFTVERAVERLRALYRTLR